MTRVCVCDTAVHARVHTYVTVRWPPRQLGLLTILAMAEPLHGSTPGGRFVDIPSQSVARAAPALAPRPTVDFLDSKPNSVFITRLTEYSFLSWKLNESIFSILHICARVPKSGCTI